MSKHARIADRRDANEHFFIDWIVAHGGAFTKFGPGAGADFVFTIGRLTALAEIKNPEYDPSLTECEKKCRTRWEQAGGKYFVWYHTSQMENDLEVFVIIVMPRALCVPLPANPVRD